jgi:hypothetical protein
MKELNAFREFLAEGEAKGFIFWFRKGKMGEEQLKKAKAILKSKKISFTSAGEMAIGFPASADEKNIKSILQDNGVTRYVIANNMEEDLAENEDRGEFEVPTNEGVYDIQLTPEQLRTEFYSAMKTMDKALSKSKGVIPQEQWDELYAVVTKVEDVAQYIGD